MDFFGIPIPDEGSVFLVTLVVHIAAGLASVAAGLVAMVSPKGGRVHIVSGRSYVVGIATLFVSMVVLAVIRWPHDTHLAILGLVALLATTFGFANRRRHADDRWHIAAMGVSYVAMLTAFYVDNGKFLPVWNLLPSWTLWIIPSVVGAPLIARAISRRFRGARRGSR